MVGRKRYGKPLDSRWKELEVVDPFGRRYYRASPVAGARFGDFIASGEDSFTTSPRTGKRTYSAVGVCACGASCTADLKRLLKGEVTSCPACSHRRRGQAQIASNPAAQVFGGDQRIYQMWSHRYTGMVSRCTDPNHRAWPNYGGRGIKVFQPWLDNRLDFFRYATTLPEWRSYGLDLDRIDNDGDYRPGNIRLVTRSRNARNRRTGRIEYLGQSWAYIDFCERFTPAWTSNAASWHFSRGRTPEEVIEAYRRYLRHSQLRPTEPIRDPHESGSGNSP